MKTHALLPLACYPDPNSEALATNAVDACAWMNADVHALALTVDVPPVSSALSRVLLNVPDMVRQAEALSRVRADHLIARVKEAATRAGVPVTTTVETVSMEMAGDRAAQRARYFDLAILGWEAGNPTSRRMTEAVVFGSGRPSLILPELTAFSAPDRIAIAWDGSRVAARALADAMPLIGRASKVLVLTVVDEKPLPEKAIGERLVDALRGKALKTEAVSIVAEDCPISVTLQERAQELGAGLLVMGAFGHSRLRDFVLGGATEGVLGDLRLPVLISH